MYTYPTNLTDNQWSKITTIKRFYPINVEQNPPPRKNSRESHFSMIKKALLSNKHFLFFTFIIYCFGKKTNTPTTYRDKSLL